MDLYINRFYLVHQRLRRKKGWYRPAIVDASTDSFVEVGCSETGKHLSHRSAMQPSAGLGPPMTAVSSAVCLEHHQSSDMALAAWPLLHAASCHCCSSRS